MTLEQLKALGLDDATADKIFNSFESINNQINTLTQQIADRDKSLSELNKNVKNIEDLNKKISDLQADLSNKDKTYSEQLVKDRKIFAIKEALLSDEQYRPYDIDLTISQFDIDSIPYDDKNNKPDITYINSKKKELIENKAFLFNQTQQSGNVKQQPFTVVSPKLEYGQTITPQNNKSSQAAIDFAKKMAEDNLRARGIKIDKEN